MFKLTFNSAFPVGNAAGWCKTLEDVQKLAETNVGFIVVGGYTPARRDGNPGNTFNSDIEKGLNSRGLPCEGIPYLEKHGRAMVAAAHKAGKQIILNINGFTPGDFAALTILASNLGFDGVEVNLACPNIVVGSKRKPIFASNVALSKKVLTAVFDVLPKHLFVLVKVSVSSDPEHILRMAKMVRGFPVAGVIVANTFPNCLLFNEDGTPQIDTPDKTGWAGGSGYQLKAIALGQVNQWAHALKGSGIDVIGAGGIACNPRPGERENDYGHDVRDMLRAGAVAAQVGTAYCVHGPRIFDDIATQYLNLTSP